MYRQLKAWGWPDWAVYKEPATLKRHPHGTKQEPEKLPLANNAAELLEEGVERLGAYLSNLPFMHEWLKGERFLTEFVYPEGDRRVTLLCHRDYCQTQESWERVCKEYGQDPMELPRLHGSS
jgi:hypothetical protein